MFEGLFRPTHLIVVLVIVLLVFGPNKLPQLGSALGQSLRDFKKAVSSLHDDERGKGSARADASKVNSSDVPG